jgi:cytochrome P450
MNDKIEKFPIGASILEVQQSIDPNPAYSRLQAEEPISWVPAFGMWYVTRYDDVIAVLRNTEHFVAGTPHSLLQDTFGIHMLTTEGAKQKRYKDAFRGAFSPMAVRSAMETTVHKLVNSLIDGFINHGEVELRTAFASRLPVQAILALFGLPLSEEPKLRLWYDDFEAALANFKWDSAVRGRAATAVVQFHDLIQHHIDIIRTEGGSDLLATTLADSRPGRLNDDEIKRNCGIIFFGGISTVEALILNTVFALLTHPEQLARVRSDKALLAKAIEETMRWVSPVQSATRHATKDCIFNGNALKAGDTVNCMLGAANRDPAKFPNPDMFDLDRSNAKQHLGFAIGDHFCLGSHLAKLEAAVAIETLLARLPGLRFAQDHKPKIVGFEFRQPKLMNLVWESVS